MKIRTKLTLRYCLLTAAVLTALMAAVYFFSSINRRAEFYADLRSEAVTKANLFLSGRVDAGAMQSIYLNNREFIDEVEVAVYTPAFELLYHDADQIDIVKETPEMIRGIVRDGQTEFNVGKYQAIGMMYRYRGSDYVVTAAAFDGYGHGNLQALALLLAVLWVIALAVIAVVGYLMAKTALRPVAQIVDRVEEITERNLDRRLPLENPADELGELSATFNNMLDRLESSFASQRSFVSNVAHELRTPMAAFITELELGLLRNDSTDQFRRTVSLALDDARRMESLISGLLDLARAGYDSRQIGMQLVRVDELLLDVRETFSKAHPEYSIEFVFDHTVVDEAMVTVVGNEYLLRTAFMNLADNNCKYSDDGSSLIQVSAHAGNCLLRFSDTGCGIEAGELERIFEPFYRGRNAARAGGSGLGLALVRRIAGLHSGSVTVNSQPGEGTVFTLRLPHQ